MSETFVLDILITGVVLTSLSAVLCVGLRCASAAHRHRFLLATAGALVLLPIATRFLPKSVFLGISSGCPSMDLLQGALEAAATQTAPTLPLVVIEPAKPNASWHLVRRIWIFGALLQSTLLLLSLIRLRSLRRRVRRVDAGPIHAALAEICRGVGIRRVPDLYVGAQLPLAWGVFRPCILLPDCASSWETQDLIIVLRHELAHVRRKDHATTLVAHLACIVHWPNPLVWLLRRQLELYRELACDAQVLADGVEVESYGKTLVRLVKRFRYAVPARTAGAWNEGLFQTRIRALSRGVRQPRSASVMVTTIVWATTFSLASVSASLTSGYAPNADFNAIQRVEIPKDAIFPDEINYRDGAFILRKKLGNVSISMTQRGDVRFSGDQNRFLVTGAGAQLVLETSFRGRSQQLRVSGSGDPGPVNVEWFLEGRPTPFGDAAQQWVSITLGLCNDLRIMSETRDRAEALRGRIAALEQKRKRLFDPRSIALATGARSIEVDHAESIIAGQRSDQRITELDSELAAYDVEEKLAAIACRFTRGLRELDALVHSDLSN